MDRLSNLPDELIVLLLLIYLDVPDWTELSKVNHRFRALILDPRLHKSRLVLTSHWLSSAILRRPSSTELYHQNVLLSPLRLSPTAEPRITHMLLTLPHRRSRDLLARALANRPSKQELSQRGLVPKKLEMGSNAAKIVKSLERQRVESALNLLVERSLDANIKSIKTIKKVEDKSGVGVTGVNGNNLKHAKESGAESRSDGSTSFAHQIETFGNKSNNVICANNINTHAQRRMSFQNISGTSVVIVKRRNYSMVSPEQHFLPMFGPRSGQNGQNGETGQPGLPGQNTGNWASRGSFSSRNITSTIQLPEEREKEREDQEEQEEYFIRKSVRALASMYTFTAGWLSQPPPPKAPPLPSWSFKTGISSNNDTNINEANDNVDADGCHSPTSPCYIDSRLLVPSTTPRFSIESLNSQSAKFDSIKQKFEKLALEQSLVMNSKPITSKHSKNSRTSGTINDFSSSSSSSSDAIPSSHSSQMIPLSRVCSSSSVSSLTSSTSSVTSGVQKPLSSQCTGVAKGAVATLRQHFISLSC